MKEQTAMVENATRARCPTDERLASFAEGRRAARERSRLVEHLDACPRCREIVATTMDTMERLGSGTARPRSWPAWAAAAAGVLLAVVLWPTDVLPPDRETDESIPWLEQAARLAASGHALPPDAARGTGYAFSGTVSPPRAAFLLGGEIVDLEVAVRRDDRARAARSGRRIVRLLRELDASARLIEQQQRLADAFAAGAVPPTAIDELRRLAGHVGDRGLRSALAVGAWVELARSGVAARDPEFVDGERLASLLEELPRDALPARALVALGEVKRLAAGDTLDESERRRLARLLDEVVELVER